ncbi:peroxisomal 2,4-dienoyl-CoA reductase, putative [Phytophthora infestans T30-4]|uniref:2,4-dienoyl-CoA reductase [(3E)-enoyl-CoA-producing] n=3 Tax=Phytophthora infestans TaxID=4787 RepID=D0NS79_PHYIT|nr:peroxisomal 2,4-dienoyl-CoA reductase, putative [Phytophthora infestans T30-4]EEY64424.1 peroxisomal 2,4-dienoyl-CoA reductase, putative [Phytophthora infestans T30-4]KAF4029226.1 Enoyl-(Acyl carrier protein) reductase [Phytophthora infestans]|eukprot:XP_002897927.1 peroxisomal 2,4-dienoyl-CoA reductase, putative [Phytophthora infestans T30-4]
MDSTSIQRVFRRDVCVGRVALVTGGGSGIGQEIAVKLAEYGAKVAVFGRRDSALQDTMDLMRERGVSENACMLVKGDVRSTESADNAVAQVVARFGKLDVLVNSAAGNFLALAEKLSTNAFRTVMEIDAIGTFNMSRAAFEPLKRSGDGRIINITATLQLPATWYQVHASAAKAAVDSITRSLALEWGQFGIRVTGVAPGPIADTTGTAKLGGDVSPEERKKSMASTVPVGRVGAKTDIAAAVLYLVSPVGNFVSGGVLIVDGGHYLYKKPVMPREALESWSKKMEKKSRITVDSKL